jgi:hypothetical protein
VIKLVNWPDSDRNSGNKRDRNGNWPGRGEKLLFAIWSGRNVRRKLPGWLLRAIARGLGKPFSSPGVADHLAQAGRKGEAAMLLCKVAGSSKVLHRCRPVGTREEGKDRDKAKPQLVQVQEAARVNRPVKDRQAVVREAIRGSRLARVKGVAARVGKARGLRWSSLVPREAARPRQVVGPEGAPAAVQALVEGPPVKAALLSRPLPQALPPVLVSE